MSAAFINLALTGGREDGEPNEFACFGHEVLDSEGLTDAVYRTFLLLLARAFTAHPGAHDFTPLDAVLLYRAGLYVPCVQRIGFTRQIDRRNDGLPTQAAVVVIEDRDELAEIFQVRRVPRLPRGIAAVRPGLPYKTLRWSRPKPIRQQGRMWRKLFDTDDVLQASDTYFTVGADDRICHARDVKELDPIPKNYALGTAWPAMVLNAEGDRRHLWQVRTTEHYLGQEETALTLGVSEAHVKSLFYARSLPLTDTGRKRPILHWVKAHERRLRAGIEIDVRKHLRGIVAFDLHGLKFQITSPEKRA